jgi:thermopsin
VTISQSVVLRRDSYEGFEVDSFSNNATVAYAVSSSAPISVALMTGPQYDAWQNILTDPISNSITYVNGTNVQNSVQVQPGQYFIVFYAYLTRALVDFGYQVYPSTPYSYGPISPPFAPGIASFGISNSSGTVTSYEVQTNQIVGLARISSLQVNTADAFRYDSHTTGFTLQLNAMLVVNDSGPSSPQKVYWIQNVPDFVTAGSQVSFGDEIWNNTDTTGFLTNQTITSTNFANGGFVYQSGTGRFSSGPNLYAYSMNNVTYRLPLNFGLLVKATVLPGTGVLVQSGYRLLSNGSAVSSTTDWYDNVTIHDSTAQAAYFDVTGNASTPTGHFYDAELVFAGEGNLETAHFIQLNATLGLFYQNASGTLSSYPTYYGFSGDTGEAADDLAVTYANGLAQLSPSVNPNYSYLGSASLSLDPNSFVVSSQTTSQTTTTSTTTTTTATSTASTTTTTKTTTHATTTSTSGATSATTTSSGSTTSTSTSASSSSTTASASGTGSITSSTQPLELSSKSTNSQVSTPLGNYILVFAIGAIVGVVFAVFAIALVRRRPLPPPPVYGPA